MLQHERETDLVLDGGSNGVIENTDNGTGLGHQSATKQIVATGCDRCEIENLHIEQRYVTRGQTPRSTKRE